MGQKVSPIGMRVGVIRDWDSRWYANKADFGDLLNEDVKVRNFSCALSVTWNTFIPTNFRISSPECQSCKNPPMLAPYHCRSIVF